MSEFQHEINRGIAQVLNNFGPGNVFDHGDLGVTMMVSKIEANRVDNVDTNRIAKHIRSRSAAFKNSDQSPWNDLTSGNIDVLRPWQVRGRLYPLTMVCEESSCRRVKTATSPTHLDRTKGKCSREGCGGRLQQLPFVVVHECGEIYQVTPSEECPNHGRNQTYLHQPGKDPATWKFRCECGERLGDFSAFCDRCQEYAGGGIPTGAGQLYYPQRAVLVDIPHVGVDQDDIPYGEPWARILMAAYLGEIELTEDRTLEDYATQRGTDQKIRNLKAKYGEEKVEENLEMLLEMEGGSTVPGRATVADMTRGEITPKGTGDKTTEQTAYSVLENQLFTFIRSTDGYEGPKEELETVDRHPHPRALRDYTSNPEFISKYPKAAKYEKKLSKINVTNAWVVDDFPLLNILYGYSRGSPAARETHLRAFDHPYDDPRLPVFGDRSPSEAIILEIDREKVVRWLLANDLITEDECPDFTEVELKKWFLNNIDLPALEDPFTEIEDPVTEAVYKSIHSTSHALMNTASDECGLETDTISELILPSIPAIILYAQSTEHFALGGMFTLFKTRIHPWVDRSISFVENCLYDTACREDHDAASCHACLQVSGLSCEMRNKTLDRNVLLGGQGYEPFWDLTGI